MSKIKYQENINGFLIKKNNDKYYPIEKYLSLGRNEQDVLNNNLNISVSCNQYFSCKKKECDLEKIKSFIDSLDDIFNKYNVIGKTIIFKYILKGNIIQTGDYSNIINTSHYFNLISTGTLLNKGKQDSFTMSYGLTDNIDIIFKNYKKSMIEMFEKKIQNKQKINFSGNSEVVVSNTSGGSILFHEAIGHGMEEDLYKNSAFDKLGKGQLFPSNISVYDDPTIENMYGSYLYDDEGSKPKKIYLIKEGRINKTLKSKLTSNNNTTGHGRRESFLHKPLVRMGNTFLENGTDNPSDIIKSVKNGFYIEKMGGGQVNTKSGEFVFQGVGVRLIEDGKLGNYIDNITLKGNAIHVLENISMIGNDLNISEDVIGTFAGTCGKGQRMPVAGGNPTFKVNMFVST